jgi:2-isopropylmalate synthase
VFSDLELHSLATGEKASGEAVVTISLGDETFKSTSIDEDVILAVAKAFVSACNQAARVHAAQPAVEKTTAQ